MEEEKYVRPDFKSIHMKRRWARVPMKEKSAYCSMMGKKRWDKWTVEQRNDHVKKMVEGRKKKRKELKDAYEKMMRDDLPQM